MRAAANQAVGASVLSGRLLRALAVLQGCGRRELPHCRCGGDVCGRCCILREGAVQGYGNL